MKTVEKKLSGANERIQELVRENRALRYQAASTRKRLKDAEQREELLQAALDADQLYVHYLGGLLCGDGEYTIDRRNITPDMDKLEFRVDEENGTLTFRKKGGYVVEAD